MSGSPVRARLIAEYAEAERAGYVEGMERAALRLAATHRFGTHPGRVPALLHAVYEQAAGRRRVELATALARIWAYGYEPERAAPFAAEAEEAAEVLGAPVLLAAALDARLLVTWGPDDLAARSAIAARLDATVAHVPDVEVRMSAHLWGLTTALESLDAVRLQRQLRALESLAAESGTARVRFFAAARRGMLELLHGELAAVRRLRDDVERLGTESGEADTEAVVHTLDAGVARQEGDVGALAAEAAAFEAFGVAEGVTSVAAEAASLWLAAGDDARAAALLGQLAGDAFAAVPRDVDWLLVVTTLVEVAAGCGQAGLLAAGITLLEPYAGRGVVNGGAVAFAGVVDDALRTACAALGRDAEAAEWAARAADGYRRLGATWWLRRLSGPSAAPAGEWTAALVPEPGAVWTVGLNGVRVAVRDMKGLHYLRALLQQPGKDLPALDLAGRVAGNAGVLEGDLGELVDRQALAAYRRRVAELDDDLAEAEQWSDPERAARARSERDALVAHLAESIGLHGRQRLAGSSAERARVAVRKAITAAIDRLEAVDPALARLLRNTVHTGATCRYEPDSTRPVRWILDAG